jgi:hypothetical protein
MSQITKFSTIFPPGSGVQTLTGDAGGAILPDAFANLNIKGDGNIIVTGTPLTNTLTLSLATTPSGLTWSREAGAAVNAAVNHGYVNTNVGLTTFTLPVVAALGTVIAIMGESAGGWKIGQRAGQNIQMGAVSTTAGIGGYLSSTNQYDVVYLVCRVANTTFSVVQSMGNITYF